jgi:hypothetical protein
MLTRARDSTSTARPRGNPASPALLLAPDFVEPFLKACSSAALLAACETCKAWLQTATRDRNLLWRALVLRRFPVPWLQSDVQDACDWLQRYKVLVRGGSGPAAEEAIAEHPFDVLKQLQGSFSFFLMAYAAEMVQYDDDAGQKFRRWVTGDLVFSMPLELRMQTLFVETGEGGGFETPHGLVLSSKTLDPPVLLPYQDTSPDVYHRHLARDLSIYVKRASDLSIAHMVTLYGNEFYDEGDGYCHWEVHGNVPGWLKCLTHGHPDAGTGKCDTFEPHLHIREQEGEEEEEDDEVQERDMRCTAIKFEFKRSTVASVGLDHYPGYGVCPYTIPMCVGDMPDILDQLTWS